MNIKIDRIKYVMVDERKETRRTQRSRAALLSPVQQTRRRRVAAVSQARRRRITVASPSQRTAAPALPT